MKVLVTGAKGFIGKNLVCNLRTDRAEKIVDEIFEYDIDSTKEELADFCNKADIVFHLAGINRPKDAKDFEGNFGILDMVLENLAGCDNKCPVMLSSSIQAELDNPYGVSKKNAEQHLIEFSQTHGNKVLIYRFPNVFGKWSRPNYNSAVATFCNNIAHSLPIKVNDSATELRLVYIDDILDELIASLSGRETRKDSYYCEVPVTYKATLGHITDLLYSFKNSRSELSIPDMSDSFTKKLYAAYLSYLPEDEFCYDLNMHSDDRGSFTEIIRTLDRGQVSVNISKPGIVKGNHWHNTKNEKFIVVYGEGVIRFRKPDSEKIIEYHVNGEKIQVVDIPTGYTHNIENTGTTDMVTIMWCSECFDPENPETYFLEV